MTTTIYLAGRFDRQDELAEYATELEALGYTVNARWLTGAHEWSGTPDSEIPRHELARFAREDLQDIEAADWLVLFAETPDAGYMSGGRHVETGYALALGKKVYVIGEGENVFHSTVPCWRNWSAFLGACRLTRAGVA